MKKENKKQAVITYDKYILIPCSGCRDRFDLYEASVNKKTGKPIKKEIGYGYRFEEAIDKMIRTGLSHRDEIADLKAYAHAFMQEVQTIKALLK